MTRTYRAWMVCLRTPFGSIPALKQSGDKLPLFVTQKAAMETARRLRGENPRAWKWIVCRVNVVVELEASPLKSEQP